MKSDKPKRRGIASIYYICPGAHIAAVIASLVIALHLLLRRDHALMSALSLNMVRPIHRALSKLWSHVNFSVAELLIGCLVLGVAIFIIVTVIKLFKAGNKLSVIYRFFVSLASVGLCIYAGFCILWGIYYYGDDFTAASGLSDSEISTQELEKVTVYFAGLLNQYGEKVQRDGDGLYRADRAAILSRSNEVFLKAEEEFPCLSGPALRAKGIYLSRVMSYLDFTGFFFPFTAEANVNMDSPPALFASTVAHELSHQRGVAKEQEANFTAVLACMSYGDIDYCYSACMLAYIHLGNALYSADRSAWQMVYAGLSENVLKDMKANREYWAQFDTPVQTVSNTVYEGFLHSYDQKLGLKSYGACVDLLVNYFLPDAEKTYG